jgi:hypothetical protein
MKLHNLDEVDRSELQPSPLYTELINLNWTLKPQSRGKAGITGSNVAAYSLEQEQVELSIKMTSIAK